MNRFTRVCQILNVLNKPNTVVFAGRGPSSSLHIAHLLLLDILSKTTSPIFFQISDDEKMIRDDLLITETDSFSRVYYRILTDSKNTVFKNTQNIGLLYEYFFKYCKKIDVKTIYALFGYSRDTKLSMLVYSMMQMITPRLILDRYPDKNSICILTGEDQTPYFELSGKFAGAKITLEIISTVPGVEGSKKMTASISKSCIFISDSRDVVLSKIKKSRSAGHKIGEIPSESGLSVDFAYRILCEFGELMEGCTETQKVLESYEIGLISSEKLKEYTAFRLSSYLDKWSKRIEQR